MLFIIIKWSIESVKSIVICIVAEIAVKLKFGYRKRKEINNSDSPGK